MSACSPLYNFVDRGGLSLYHAAMQLLRTVRNMAYRGVSTLFPDQSIESSKKKWNMLGAENPRYYVVSKKGTKIAEEEFQESGEENYDAYIRKDALLTERLAPFKEKRVLDIGSGLGRLTEFFARDFKSADGVDISDSMVAQATKRLEHVSNIHFHATDGKSFPFPDGTFDLVFSYIVFQHMPSREIVEENFKEAYRVLVPGGTAKIQIRGGHAPFKWQWFYGPSFSEPEGRALAERAGFTVLKTEGAGTKRFWLWLAKS